MKITEKALLQAIGHADEKMIQKTAPRQWDDNAGRFWHKIRRPRLQLHRAAEVFAVLAACFVFACSISLIRSLSADVRMRNTEPDKYAARAALTEFMDGWKKGDKEQMLNSSLIEKMAESNTHIGETDYDPEEDIQSTLDMFLDINVLQYKIGDGEDATERWKSLAQEDLNWKEWIYYYYLEIGETEIAEQWRTEYNEVIAIYSQCDMAYSFPVKARFPEMLFALLFPDEIEIEFTKDGYSYINSQLVVRYNGEWRVLPSFLTIPWPDERTEKLEEYREKYGPVEFPID